MNSTTSIGATQYIPNYQDPLNVDQSDKYKESNSIDDTYRCNRCGKRIKIDSDSRLAEAVNDQYVDNMESRRVVPCSYVHRMRLNDMVEMYPKLAMNILLNNFKNMGSPYRTLVIGYLNKFTNDIVDDDIDDVRNALSQLHIDYFCELYKFVIMVDSTQKYYMNIVDDLLNLDGQSRETIPLN